MLKLAAAKALTALMPRIEQGNAVVVEREDLIAWISACIEAEDTGALT